VIARDHNPNTSVTMSLSHCHEKVKKMYLTFSNCNACLEKRHKEKEVYICMMTFCLFKKTTLITNCAQRAPYSIISHLYLNLNKCLQYKMTFLNFKI
jgi:hypothetical protein